MEQKLKDRLNTLREQREQFITNANQTIYGFNSVIAEIESLLTPPENEPVSIADED